MGRHTSRIRSELLRWYDRARRDLPWRHAPDPYRVWVSEVMLQQTRVEVVVPYYRRFLARFPDAQALAAAPLAEVLAAWSGLGYYARARNLHAAARQIVDRHGGALPEDPDALAALPGFGRYTLGAVRSIAFGAVTPVVDGNVARVLSRLAARALAPAEQWRRAAELVPADRPGDFNQALMELGATVCTPRAPRCAECPLARECAARRAGTPEAWPPPREKPARRKLVWACALVERRGKILLARRPEEGLFGGLWELPSAPPAVLVQALADGLGLQAAVGEEAARVAQALTHRELLVIAYRTAVRGRLAPRAWREARWATFAEAQGMGISSVMRKLLRRIILRPPR